MLEIYSQKSWVSTFKSPSFIVDDEGLIYNADEYRKLIRNPIGKIDYSSGYIYGPDYFKSLRSPMGQIKQDGDVTMVFGEDYIKNIRSPSFYVQGNVVYSYKEYHSSFPTPSYYIVQKDSSSSSNTNNIKSSTRSNPTNIPGGLPQAGTGLFDAIGKIVKPILIVLLLILFSVGAFNNFIHDSDYSGLLLISIPIGFVGALVAVKKNDPFYCILFVEAICVVVCYGGILVIDGDEVDIWEIIFSPFLIALMMAVPSIITGTIVYYIKKLFKK